MQDVISAHLSFDFEMLIKTNEENNGFSVAIRWVSNTNEENCQKLHLLLG